MTPRTINLLHVEDSRAEQLIMAHRLASLSDFQFRIRAVATEEAALAEFHPGAFGLVIMDFRLAQGDGLSCLRQLRERDPIVPIIAMSGNASPQIAATFMKEGADNYLQKPQPGELFSRPEEFIDSLAGRIRDVVTRSENRIQRKARQVEMSIEDPTHAGELFSSCRQLSTAFFLNVGPQFLQRIDELEAIGRSKHLTPSQLKALFDNISSDLDSLYPSRGRTAEQTLRPLFLELLQRLCGEPAPRFEEKKAG